MRIGIITDAHLFHKYAIKPEIYSDIIKNKFKDVDFIVDCGDLTDKSNLTADQLDIIFNIFDGLDKPMYIVAGNHDSLNGTTVASVLSLNKNITVIRNEPQVIDNCLFIPYTDNIKDLYKKLNKLITEQLSIAFSHLNITSNFYATLPFSKLKNLHKYADTIINGHIHTPENDLSIYGNTYNVGSCSSLTFGDEHIPCYSIYDTDANIIENFSIKNSVIHRTYNLNEIKDTNEIYEDINELISNNYILRCRFNLRNNETSIDIRKRIVEDLSNNDNILNISFNYVKDKDVAKKHKKNNQDINKIPLMQQLFNYFERDCEIKLDDSIKKELL